MVVTERGCHCHCHCQSRPSRSRAFLSCIGTTIIIPGPGALAMPPRKKVKAKSKSTSNAGLSKPTTDTASRPKTIRGRRGGLKDMPNMPLDVLLEVRVIFCVTKYRNLNPLSLVICCADLWLHASSRLVESGTNQQVIPHILDEQERAVLVEGRIRKRQRPSQVPVVHE